jgi:hypothetical protein
MPADMELMHATRTVHSRGWGALSDGDLFGHIERIAALFQEGVLDRTWAQICDFTEAESMTAVTSIGVLSAAERNPWPPDTIRAFIVKTDEQFGLVRMYQLLGDPKTQGLSITRSVADANAYIATERARLGIDG